MTLSVWSSPACSVSRIPVADYEPTLQRHSLTNDRLPAQPTTDPAAKEQLTLALEPTAVLTKLHLKNGAPGVPGSDLYGSASRTLGYEPGAALRIADTFRDPMVGGLSTLALEASYVQSDGDNGLAEGLLWDGTTIHRIRTSADIYESAIDLRHHVALTPWLDVQAGGAIEGLGFHGRFRTDVGDSNLSFFGVFLEPRVTMTIEPMEWLAVDLNVAGFVQWPLSSASGRVRDPQTLGATLRVHRESWFAELGYRLDEGDLAEQRGSPSEDSVHMRLRSIQLGMGIRF